MTVFIIIIILIFIVTTSFVIYCRNREEYINLNKHLSPFLIHKELPLYYNTAFFKKEAFRRALKLQPIRLQAYFLMAIKNPELALRLLKKQQQKTPLDVELALLCASLELEINGTKAMFEELSSIKRPKVAYLRASYDYLLARYQLYITDFESACQNIFSAQDHFNKTDAFYETAQCYELHAQICRLCHMTEESYNLFLKAEKIYKTLNLPAKIAEINAYIGMIEMTDNNFELSFEHLIKAKEITIRYELYETLNLIENWLGMLSFKKKDEENAKIHFEFVYNASTQAEIRAFAAEMLASIHFSLKQYDDALKYTTAAHNLYQQTNSTNDIFDTLYLEAQIHYNNKDYPKSRSILTALIRDYRHHHQLTSLPNAYTLLGLIELEEKNLNKAETLFKQALDLEHSKNRTKGATVDYNNLAEVYRAIGDKQEMRRYLELALNTAIESEDEEMIAFIKNKLN